MNNKMHQFTIDYLTTKTKAEKLCVDGAMSYGIYNKNDTADDGYFSRRSSRHTPSPSDSGMESDNSPGKCDGKKNEEDESAIVDVLLSLEKNAASSNAAADECADEKPSHSYIALISMAILSSSEKKMLLSDIYQYVKENFGYYNNDEKAWRNSIRHNLSLNECFVKAGRADNGKGNYWAIHPACVDDFAKGDFRRRQARRRARKCQKDTSYPDMRSSYGYNVGYVPMTTSHIEYHPYRSATSPNFYPQFSALTSSTSPTSTFSFPSTISESAVRAQSSALTGCRPACSVNAGTSVSSASPTAISAAAQRFLAEQANTTMFTMQALAQQQLAASLQMQNW